MGVVAVVAFGAFLLPQAVHALTIDNVGSTLGLGSADLKETIINVIKWALGLLGLVAVIVILYGGFLWLTSRGNEQQIDKAKRVLINGVIGLVIILLSWAIVLFVQRFVTNSTNSAQAAQCGPAVGIPFGRYGCMDCVDDGDGQHGTYINNNTCFPPTETETWNAINEQPNIGATNVKLCSQAVEIFGGLRIGSDNNPSAGAYTVSEVINSSNTIAGTTYLGTDRTATFFHTTDFKPNTEYEVIRTTPFMSSSTPALPLTLPPVWRFTTGTEGDETPPTVSTVSPTNTINCLKPEINVMFSEPMLPLSVHIDNITVTPTPSTGAKLVGTQMNANLDGFKAYFDKPLDPSQTYTIRLNAETDPAIIDSSTGGKFIQGFKDLCVKNALDGLGDGNATLDTPADDYVWTFTTANTTTVECTPKITAIEPTAFYGNSTSDGQQALTITGENFGATDGLVLFPGGSAVASTASGSTSSCFNTAYRPKQATPVSVACIPASGWTDRQITTLVPAGLTPSASATGPVTGGATDGPVTIQTTLNSPPSNAVDQQSPHIDWVSPQDGKVGTFVTINGTHFGNTPGRVVFRKTDGTEVTGTIPACAGSNGWTEDSGSQDKRSQIIIQVPAGFNVNELADIQVEHDQGTVPNPRGRSNLHRFTINDVERPGLCSITPQCHNTGGGTVAVVGQGLGNVQSDITSYYIPSDRTRPTTNGTLSSFNSGAGTINSQAGNIGQDQYQFQLSVGTKATNPLNYKIPCLPAPAVVTDSSCNIANNIVPSPNPTPNATNVCRNINLGIRFNQSMDVTDLDDDTKVVVRRCDNATDFTCDNPQAVVINATRSTYAVPNDSAVYVPTAGNLTNGYWYEVRVLGTVRSATGVAIGADYTWHFQVKAGGEDCPIDAVGVLPGYQGPRTLGQLSTVQAKPYTNTCAILSNATTFAWQTSDAGLAPLSTISNASYTDDQLDSIVPTGNYDGTAVVRATAGGKTGAASIQVIRGYCETNDTCNAQCGGSICDPTTKRCTPVVSDVDPISGPAGNIVNVNGCFFGNSVGTNGKVQFTNAADSNQSYPGSFALCGPAGWTNSQIRVQAAPDFAAPGTNWKVQVTTDARLLSNDDQTYNIANVCRSTTNGTVPIPPSGVPIVCSIAPSAAREGATVQYAGDKFKTTAPASQAFFSQARGTAGQLPVVGGSTVIASARNATTRVPVDAGQPVSGTSQSSIGTPSGGDYCLATPVDFNVSCTQNNECGTGCCASGICSLLTTCTDGMILDIVPSAGNLQCRNTAFVITFDRDMQPGSLNSSTIQLQRTTGVVVPSGLASSGRVVTVTPNAPLDTGVSYQIFIQGGTTGVVTRTNHYMSGNWTAGPYPVLASATICRIARTAMVPADDLFTCSGNNCAGDVQPTPPGPNENQHAYSVVAYDANNVPLALQGWNWTQGDGSGSHGTANVYDQGATGPSCPTNSTSSTYCSQSANVANGQESLSVQVTGANGAGTGNATGTVRSFLCANPWPSGPTWPFTDPAIGAEPTHNFTLAYCGDDVGSATLRLPVVGGLTNGANNLRKEYFMLVQDTSTGRNTGDAIGVRVHGNPGDLSPDRWYRSVFNRAPSGSTLDVDGYPAVREGRTVYVSATNCTDVDCSTLFPNMYVFSYSDNAKPETIKIFEQLLQNIRFNVNATAFTPADHAMLRRDTKRVHAYNEIVYGLDAYAETHNRTYPKLDAGSYLLGLTTSAWPSWQQVLGKDLQITMPKDVAPKWDEALCPDANTEQATCWNQSAKTFTFPSNTTEPPESHAIMYRYNSPTDSAVYGTLEQNRIRNSIIFLAQTDSFGLPSQNACPAPSLCNGFNLRIGQAHYSSIVSAKRYVAASSDRNNPVVAITLPAAGAVLGTVDVVVTATDSGTGESGIANVQFVVTDTTGKIVASSTVSAPGQDGKYHWLWNTRPLFNASHTLTVTATDNANKVGTATRTYTLTNPPGDSLPPAIVLGNPNAANFVFNGSDVTLTATATEPAAPNNSGVTKVEFYLGTSEIGQATCSGACSVFSASSPVAGSLLRQFSNGNYTYSVVAYDVAGNTSIAQIPVVVRLTAELNPPTISIVTPTTTISGALTDAVVDATDSQPGDVGMDRVEFFIDGEATPRTRDYSQPYTYSWSHTGYANNSSHTIRAVAYDRAGNQATATRTVVYSATQGPDTTRPVISNVTATLANNSTVPLSGASLTDGVTINATLTDNVAILRAELLIDGNRIPLTGGSYYPINAPTQYGIRYAWNTLPELVGSHPIAIVLYDTANNVTTYSANVTVDNRIIMTISAPRSSTTVKDAATGVCSRTRTRTCTTARDCPLTEMGSCESNPGSKCLGDSACTAYPGDFCMGEREACSTTGSGVPVVIDISKTCRQDLQLSSVQFFMDNSTTPFATINNCTNGRCNYTWPTLTTTSNGTHVLKAIGTDSTGCRGGAQTTVIVNNDVNDTIPPTINSFQFGTQNWGSPTPAYINNAGLISVTAQDNNGGSGLAQINILVNGTVLATCATSPCVYNWNPPDGGNYTVLVQASDVAGNNAPDQQQIVNVDRTPPTGTWSAPATGSTVSSPPSVNLQANANDPQTNGYASGIASVIFYQNGVPFGQPGTQSGSTWTLNTLLTLGANSPFHAVITDQANNTFTTSPDALITVAGPDTIPPAVNITIPDTDNYWNRGNVLLEANARDNPGGVGVRDVEFFVNGTSIGLVAMGGYVQYTWNSNTGAYPDTNAGTGLPIYSITARACDRNNNCTTSQPRLIKIINGTPGNLCGPIICSGATPICCSCRGFSCTTASQVCAACTDGST